MNFIVIFVYLFIFEILRNYIGISSEIIFIFIVLILFFLLYFLYIYFKDILYKLLIQNNILWRFQIIYFLYAFLDHFYFWNVFIFQKQKRDNPIVFVQSEKIVFYFLKLMKKKEQKLFSYYNFKKLFFKKKYIKKNIKYFFNILNGIIVKHNFIGSKF